MKKIALYPFLLLLLVYSCGNKTTSSDKKTFTIDHPNAAQFEWMINNYKEAFITDVEHEYIAGDTLILYQAYFITKNTKDTVSLFFCKNQNDAITLSKNHFIDLTYGVNGGVLFVVQGQDEYRTNDLLSWFAGEE